MQHKGPIAVEKGMWLSAHTQGFKNMNLGGTYAPQCRALSKGHWERGSVRKGGLGGLEMAMEAKVARRIRNFSYLQGCDHFTSLQHHGKLQCNSRDRWNLNHAPLHRLSNMRPCGFIPRFKKVKNLSKPFVAMQKVCIRNLRPCTANLCAFDFQFPLSPEVVFVWAKVELHCRGFIVCYFLFFPSCGSLNRFSVCKHDRLRVEGFLLPQVQVIRSLNKAN